ncbi:hypothetical protein CSB20_10690, partial [bacterium DOLZORAL124_64_63]
MRQWQAIVRRETGAFFHSAMAPVLLGGFLVLVGFLFAKMMVGYSDLSTNALQSARSGNYVNLAESVFRPLVSTMLIFVVLLMPSLTMRLFSPEYRSGRYNLLASWPVADHVWVLGKWWAAVLSAWVLLGSTLVFFLSVWLFGSPEPGPLLTVFLGLFLLAAALTAWGLFFSTVFSHQILSYFVTLVLAMLLFMVHLLERFLPGVLGQAALDLSLLLHFERFSRGVLDSRDVIYFLLLMLVPLTGATALLAGRRLPARRRGAIWLPPLLAMLVACVLYALAGYFPVSLDTTGNKRYSLAPQTVKILRGLGQDLEQLQDGNDVVVYGFFQRHDPIYDSVDGLLRSFRQQNRHFRFEMLNPETELEMLRRYDVKVARTMVVTVGDRHTLVLQPQESGLINAVYRLVHGRRPVIGYLQGHGEHQLDNTELAGYASTEQALTEQGYDVRPLVLSETGGVPRDCDLVILAGPRTDPLTPETVALDRFLARGGSVLALCDPPTPSGWVRWLAGYRVALTGDVIITASSRTTISRLTEVVDSYGGHEIVKPLLGVRTLFPFAQPIGILEGKDTSIEGAVLLGSSEVSWAERDPGTRFSGRAGFDPGEDVQGPLPMAVLLEKKSDMSGPPGRMVVVGNSEWLNNSMANRDGNRDLLLNMVGWLAREEDLIELRGRDPFSQP